VLGAAVVALRLPGFVAGFSAMFIVLLVAGNAFGPGFGFLLGIVGMFASGLFVGGLGPWLPFEMVAFGWVGAGAGLLPHGSSWRERCLVLAAYGLASGYLYGAVMNLWSWPFLTEGSSFAWDPSAGAGTNLRHYAAFYAATSFAWDTFRAVGNAVLVIALGRPFLAALDRAGHRMHVYLRGLRPSPGWPPTGALTSDNQVAHQTGTGGGPAVSKMPPSFWEDPDAFEPGEAGTRGTPEGVSAEEEHLDHEHEHGPECGHEAVEHGDHTDYVDEGHRHFLREGRWFHHKTEAGTR
jgi:hypothetical protein